MTLDDAYETYDNNGIGIITERTSGAVVGAFYPLKNSPGWWHGHAHGRARTEYMPDAAPADVAAQFMSRH